MHTVAHEAYIETSKMAFGNSNSLHDIGEKANHYLAVCRKTFASLIGGDEKGVIFTSGGTESNWLAIQTLLSNTEKKHLVLSKLEHSSIANFMESLKSRGYDITYVENDGNGAVDVESVKKAIRSDTAIVSIQHGNSEIGIVQPIQQIAHFLKEQNIFFHTDCVQTFGKVPIHASQWEASAYSFSSHKLYGPKGVGAIYFDPSLQLKPTVNGTSHEFGYRAGTVNVPGICSFVTMAKYFHKHVNSYLEHMASLRTYLINEIVATKLPLTVINKDYQHQLPHIVGLISSHYEGQYLMLELNRKGIAISTGTACQVGMMKPSKTIESIGIDEDKKHHFIRLSFGMETTTEDLDRFIQAVKEITL